MGANIIIAIISLLVGSGICFGILQIYHKKTAQEREAAAELLKKNKIIEAKEHFIALKLEHEQQVQQKNARLQSLESKLQSREMQLNQRHGDIQRKLNEAEAIKETYTQQANAFEVKKRDLEQVTKQVQVQLETISGLSTEQAKEQLVESLKDEAKANAMSYINEIMDDAKLTANKEAKKIVVQSIQRVATEAAVENSVTV
ncbi:MAG: Rnase Y domain-containing protein, partial [Paludibacter sp.]|nr:Rnase Y domain-containing protein [Paludibacter sp.]